ncbi:unnamed protein product [Brachionus calyciflorus]|uniref:Hepatocyte growth factor-regulated tyrosine kinase substrate n=1 Tax=Brachionus calyciflorus TaxID=104777 RepID=A0A813NMJ7_9BILA|nr:unnamed protein product [Brachionus calyciflorus]
MSQTKVFDKLLEKATSSFLLENDWESILKICDLIRQNDVTPKYVVAAVKKKLSSDNIHTVTYALECIESMVKNCGSKIHQEIIQKDFMDQMKSLCQQKPDPVKSKCLSLIQCWSHAFRKNPNYRLVEDFYNQMKIEGFQFPVLKESEAMFDVEEAPLWIQDSDSTCCYRCRSEFSILNRRHHCRACGQIFCNSCSSKQAPIPKFGIEKEVRVCDACYDKLKTSPVAIQNEYLTNQFMKPTLPSVTPTQTAPKTNEKTEQEFEEELQLALALSESEAEAKKQQQKKFSSYNYKPAENKEIKASASAPYLNDISNEYERDIPVISSKKENTPKQETYKQQQLNEPMRTEADEKELENDAEIDKFIEDVKKTLELYINRMKADSVRGRSITNDTAVQSLFLQLQHLQPKLMSFIKYKEDMRGYYENLQDKLTQLKDAREVLNALRQEHYDKKRKEFEEKEKMRQLQIAQKLQYMRQQKQTYYLYQQQMNLQKLQEQEMNLKMRLNQQREMVMQRELINTGPGNLNYANPIVQPSPFLQHPMYSNNMPNSETPQLNQMLQQQQIPNWAMNQNQYMPNPALPPQNSQSQIQQPVEPSVSLQSVSSSSSLNQYPINYIPNIPNQPMNNMLNYAQNSTQIPNNPIPSQMNYSSYQVNPSQNLNQAQYQVQQVVNQATEVAKPQETVPEAQLISFD